MKKTNVLLIIGILIVILSFTVTAHAGGGLIISDPGVSEPINTDPPSTSPSQPDSSSTSSIKIILDGKLRSDISRSPSSAVCDIHEGETYEYTGEDLTDNRMVRWFKVRYNNGYYYVSSQLGVVSDPNDYENTPSSYGLTSVYVTGESVNIRTAASLSGKIVAVVHSGNTYSLDSTVIDDRGVAWYHVSLPDGRTGYISTIYCYPY